MSDNHFDPEQVFAQIAAITPAPGTTPRALVRTKAALPTAAPARLLRWIIPASLAAAILLAITITLALLPAHASAQEALATTLKADEAYKGWVHLGYGNDNKESLTWNTQTHTSIRQSQETKPGSAPTTRIFFQDPIANVLYDYRSAAGTLRIGLYRAELRGDADSSTPLDFPALLQKLRDIAGQTAVTIAHSADRGMDRFDITIAPPAIQRLADIFHEGAGSLGRPSTVWVDPKSKLIRAALVEGQEIHLSYGGPDVHTIYDAGVPREAKVIDNRPAPETLAVVNRLRARADKPFPHGVVAVLTTRNNSQQLQVYDRAGDHWTMRSYGLPSLDKANSTYRGLQMPAHWQDADADEFFHRVAAIFPNLEVTGDATHAWESQYDLNTGKQFVSIGNESVDKNGKTSYSETKLNGPQESTGQDAIGLAHFYNPTRDLYPRETNAAFSTDNHLDLLTAPDRPGQLCVHVVFPAADAGQGSRAITQEWFDPAHDDRPVTFQTLAFANSTARQIQSHSTTQFSGYQSLPAPDGRSYPTTWIETDYDGNNNVQGVITTELHFFPGRRLPDIPKKP